MVLLIIAVVLLLLAVVITAYMSQPAPAASGRSLEASGQPAVAANNGEFVVGCYNIHGGKGEDGRRDLKRCASVIDDADIVGLQEVHAATHFGRACQLSALAGFTGMGSLFAPARTRWFRDFRGNGLLSRFAVEHWSREPLPDRSGRNYRCLLTAKVNIAGQSVWLLVTHLHTREGRKQQLETVFKRFHGLSPAVLIGDFNTPLSDPMIKPHLEALQELSGDEASIVHPTVNNVRGVDWIICRGLTLVGAGVDHSDASDHPYYWARFRLARH